MADNTYWMRTPDGASAFITGDDERDRWIPHGLIETAPPQPGPGVFVWCEHEVHGGRAKFPADVVEEWAAKGWHPSPPEEPVDLTRDPVLSDVPAGVDVPEGTVAEVLDFVGDDPAKAREALAAEKQRDKPRATLTDALTRVAEPTTQQAAVSGDTKE